jgi:dipeptidyl aminopeptidase/acylaminoacyl peptidase
MTIGSHVGRVGVLVFLLGVPIWLLPQGKPSDYTRARLLRLQTEGLVYDSPEPAAWIANSHRFWYRKAVKGGNMFMVVDADALAKQPAFDHEKLAASLSAASGQKYTAFTLPFDRFAFVDGGDAIEFQIESAASGESTPAAGAVQGRPASAAARWRCRLSSFACTKGTSQGMAGQGGQPVPELREGQQPEPLPRTSPNQKMEAFVRNYNIWVRNRETREEFQLSRDGSEADQYSSDPQRMRWSPDSAKLAVFRVKVGVKREVHYIQSSPEDQLQPKHSTLSYHKPGDVIDVSMPVLFHVDGNKQINIDNQLFSTPFENSQIDWWRDGRAFTFEYNQRGHQAYRVIEVDSLTGKPRALINEETPTFFCYSGKKWRFDVDDGKEIIWMSERDGWNHLYLYDGATGTVKNQITKGRWVVRGVDRIDETARQIWFRASGMYEGKDPYFVYCYRINFDGTGLVTLTQGDGTHAVFYPSPGGRSGGAGRGGPGSSGASSSFSADMIYYVDTYSRIDLPPVMELHRTSDQKSIMEVEHADMQDLIKSGWIGPEAFVAKGRDGQTHIWGVIYRPRNLDPARKYPVIENIYAGPQDSYVPKAFSAYNPMQSLAELGFVVVQIDGMGTSNRSKVFHDVAWKNLGDAGFPDRILWHKAVAAKYPYYDISRVGIYGASAGGQNSMGALLFHPEFYKVAVSISGCHDNRMDKIWWNEQWMGYPVGPEYAAASNVENAFKLRGKLLLVVGEMDKNVDPSSTLQVCNALIKAGKYFDLLYVPNGGHGAGGEYGERKRNDFFVRHLLGIEPPDWNTEETVRK